MRKLYLPALLAFLTLTLSWMSTPALSGMPAALIIQQPVSVAVGCIGDSATFTVVAIGGDLSYQWTYFGRDIPGATGPSYTIDSVRAEDDGGYDVLVRDASANIADRSRAAYLTISQAPRITGRSTGPRNCGHLPARLSVTATGHELRYQWYRNNMPIPGATESSYTVDAVSPENAGAYSVEVFGSCGRSVTSHMPIRTMEPVRLFKWTESQMRMPGAVVGATVLLHIKATGDELRYQWYKDNVPLSNDDKDIRDSYYMIDNVQAFDVGLYSVMVYNECSMETSGGMRVMMGYQSGPADRSVCSGQFARFVAPDTTDLYAYQWSKDGVDIPGATLFHLDFPSPQLADQGLYSVAVTLLESGALLVPPPARLTVTKSVEFIAEPQSQILCHGQPLRLHAEAIGESVTYQWWKNGMMIPGATSPVYDLPSAIASNSGFYNVAIKGECGELLSDEAHVLVAARTGIDEQPVGRTVLSGESVTFFVTATGTDLTYQWRKNGVEMATYEDSYITLAKAGADDAATYDVVITDGCGAVHISEPAVLVVRMPSAVPGRITSAEKGKIVVTPHPASGSTRVQITLPEGSLVEHGSLLSLYDTRGSFVRDLVVEDVRGSVAVARFEASDLASGVYHLRLESRHYSGSLGSIVVGE